ncbi:alpha-ribazole phosphatase family protein [Simiduia litorea]|uniref:histidine phosphatase family protein n=1 Tax=Simiduia litorea TaxID=1435348 RepID=UPI0036F42E2F
MTATSAHDSTRVYLLRHGECEGGQIFRGHTDSAPTEAGQNLVLARLNSLAGISLAAVISSPAQRCRLAAEAFASDRALPFVNEQNFLEIYFGQWEGQLVADVADRMPTETSQFWRDPLSYTPPMGEALLAFQARVIQGWQNLLAQYRGQTVVLVTHGGVIRMILADVLAMPLRPLSHLAVPHGCLSCIQFHHAEGQPDWPQLLFHNGQVGDDY